MAGESQTTAVGPVGECKKCGFWHDLRLECNGPQTAPSLDLWEIGRRHAREAMAAIAERQMKTWDKLPPMSGPTMLIAEAIVNALKEAGVVGND